MTNKIKFTQNDKIIAATLKDKPEGLTLYELNQTANTNLISGNIVSAIRKGLIEVVGEKEILKPAVRKVATYSFNKDYKIDEKTKLTESELQIVGALNNYDSNETFCLKDLSDIVGRHLTSGNINGLVKKGVFSKVGELAHASTRKTKVNIYGWVTDPVETETESK